MSGTLTWPVTGEDGEIEWSSPVLGPEEELEEEPEGLGTYEIWYARSWIGFGSGMYTVCGLEKTHVMVCTLDALDLGDAFRRMQGEVWSPNGEARELIERLGLTHTSMSAGDVIYDGQIYWLCLSGGWKELK